MRNLGFAISLVVVALSTNSPVFAQLSIWNSPNTGLVSDPLNWATTVPPNNPQSIWEFGGMGTDSYGIFNDFPAGYQLNGINWTSTSQNAILFIPTQAGPTSLAFSLNPTGGDPFFNMSGAGPVFFTTPITLAATNMTFSGNGTGPVYFNGTMTGAGRTITKSGSSRLVLQQDNNTTLTGSTVWNINGGSIDIGNSINRLGSITASTVTVNFNGGTLTAQTSGGSASASRSFNFQSGTNTLEVGVIGTNFSVATSPWVGSAGASFRKTGPGIMSLGSVYATFNSDITVADGSMLAGADGAFGTGTAVNVLPGATVGSTSTGTLTFTAPLNRTINASGVGFVDITAMANNGLGSGAYAAIGAAGVHTYANPINLNGQTSISGTAASLTLSAGVGETTAGSSLVKDGVVQLNLNAANTYTGSTTIRSGTLSLGGLNGSLTTTSSINVGAFASTVTNQSGRLTLDNSTANNTNRVGDGIPVNMRSGALNLVANAAISATETLGPLTLESGTSAITVIPQTLAGAQLTLSSIARNNRSTAILRGTALGGAAGSNVSNIFVNSGFVATDFSGVPDSAGPDREVLRWGAGTTTTGLVVNNFITRDAATGLRFLAAGEITTTTNINSALNGQNIRNNASGNVTNDAAINALDVNGNTLSMANNTFLRINSGLIISNTTTVSVNNAFNAAVVDYGSQEPIFAGQAVLFNSYLVSNNGLTRAAGQETAVSSTLTLNQPNVINGPITMNGIGNTSGGGNGRILVNNLSSLGNPNNPWNFAGGLLIIQAAQTATLPNNWTMREGGGELNFGAGSADPGPLFTHTGTITGSGRFTKSGAATLVITQDNAAAGFTGQTAVTSGILSISNANNLGTGELLMNGGRLLVTGDADFAATRPVGMNAASAISVNAGNTMTIQGILVGSFALTKNGPGTLAPEGLNTSNSALTISGSPSLRQPDSGGSVVFRGPNGQWRSSNAIQSNSTTSLVLDNAVANNNNRLRDEAPSSTAAAVTIAGGTMRMVGNASVPTHELMGGIALGNTTGALDGTLSRINLEPATGRQMILSPTFLNRTTTGSSKSQLLLTGPIPVGPNPSGWLNSSIANLIPQNAPALTGNATGTGSQTPIFAASMGDTAVGGNGTGFLTFHPASGMRLLGATEYDPTFANGSANLVNVRTAGNITGIDSPTTINSLILNGGHDVSGIGTLTLNSGTLASLGATPNSITNVVITTPSNLAVNMFVNQDLAVSGAITGTSGGLVKSGPGRLTLSGGNGFTGGLSILGGTVSAAADSALGATNGFIFLDGGTLQITSSISMPRQIHVLAGGGTIDTGSNTVTVGNFTIGGTGTVTAGFGPVTKTGDGTLVEGSVSGSAFAGGLRIQQGTVLMNAGNANISDGAPVSISTGATFRFATTVATNNDIIGSIAGAGTLDLAGLGYALTVGSASSITPDTNFSGNITGVATSSVIKGGQGDWTLTPGAVLSNFPGTWTVAGGRLILGGNALLNTDGVLGNGSSAIAVGSGGADTAALVTNGSFTVARPITILTTAGTAMSRPSLIGSIANSGTTVFSGNISVGSQVDTIAKLVQFHASGSSTVDVQGQIITGANGYTGVATIEKVGSGTVQLSNPANTYTGRTVVTSGTLAIGANGTATQGPLGTSTFVINGGTVSAAGAERTIHNPTILNGDVTFGGTFPINFAPTNPFYLGLGDRTITVNAPRVTINSEIRGSQGFTGFGGIIKNGPGILELTGANTYSGTSTTVVDGGTLLVDNTSGSGTGNTMVLVNAGKLGGTGTIGGNVTINGGGTMAPGISPGTLTLQNGVLFNPGSILELEFNGFAVGQYDQLRLTGGGINLGNAMVVNTFAGFMPNLTEVFTVINNEGMGLLTGTFNGLPEGAIVASNVLGSGIDYIVQYGTYPGLPGSVVFAPVPEPATVLGICAIGAGAVGFVRRRMSRKAA